MNTSDTTTLESEVLAAGTSRDDFGTDLGEVMPALGEVPAGTSTAVTQAPLHASKCNIGHTEQKFRIGAGTALLAVAAFAPLSRGWRIGLAAVGAAELVTGTTRYCPVSQMLGINTCRPDER